MKGFEGPGSERDQVRFFAKVALPNEQGCMLWLAGLSQCGYGKFWINGHTVHAHRFAYTVFVGEIPEGLVIDHLCRNHACVTPDHLDAVTNAENVRRGIGPGWKNARKTHCPQGHPYNEENTHLHISGGRRCRECGRQRWREWDRRRRANAVA